MQRNPVADQAVDLIATCIAAGVVGQYGILRQILATNRQHETPEDGIAIGADRHVLAILRGMRIRRRDAGHDVAGPFAHEPKNIKLRHQRLHHGEDGLVERNVDHLPLAAIHLLVTQSHHRADDAPQRSDRIADGNAGFHRWPVGKAGNVAQAAHRLADGPKARLRRHRPGLAETRKAHHDQPGVFGRQCIPTKPQLVENAGAKILDHDVGFARQMPDDGNTLRMFQIDRDRLFVAGLQIPPEGSSFIQLAPLTQRITAIRRFDLDHLGTELRHDARSEGAGNESAELKDFEASQRFLLFSHVAQEVPLAKGRCRWIRRSPPDFAHCAWLRKARHRHAKTAGRNSLQAPAWQCRNWR